MSPYETELRNYCYMVQRGKPAASIAVLDRYLDQATEMVVREYGLRVYTEPLSDGWVILWVYRHEHILAVIQSTPQTPKTPFEHWVLGKLYGYDESAIGEYLQTRLGDT